MLPYRSRKVLHSSTTPPTHSREDEPLAMPRVLNAMKRQRYGENAQTSAPITSIPPITFSSASSSLSSSPSSSSSSAAAQPGLDEFGGYDDAPLQDHSQSQQPTNTPDLLHTPLNGDAVGSALGGPNDAPPVAPILDDKPGAGLGFASTIPAQMRFSPVSAAPVIAMSEPVKQPRSFIRVRPPVLAVLAGVAVVIVLAQAVRETPNAAPVIAQIDRLAALTGLGITQVSLKGHRLTPDGDIFDALELDKHRSMLSFSITQARARLEALPWIDKASVLRELPGQLVVEVSERDAFAVWRSEGKHQLIDATGRVLSLIKPDGADHLPLVIGVGAADLAKGLLDAIAAYPKIAKRLVAIERVGQRRWTLWFAGGPRADLAVHLPQDDEVAAIARLNSLNNSDGVLNKALAAIDLRLPYQLTLRPIPSGRPGHARSSKLGSSGRS